MKNALVLLNLSAMAGVAFLACTQATSETDGPLGSGAQRLDMSSTSMSSSTDSATSNTFTSTTSSRTDSSATVTIASTTTWTTSSTTTSPTGCCQHTFVNGTCLNGYATGHNFCGGANATRTVGYATLTQAQCPTESTSGIGAIANIKDSCSDPGAHTGASCSDFSGETWSPTSCETLLAAAKHNACQSALFACTSLVSNAFSSCVAGCNADPDPGWLLKRYSVDQCIAMKCRPASDAGATNCTNQFNACLAAD